MEITYTLTTNDLVRFNNFLIKRIPAMQLRLALLFLWFPFLLCLLTFGLLHGPVDASGVFIVLATSAVWGLYLWWGTRRAVIRRNKDTPGVLGLRTLRIGPQGVQAKTPIADTTLKWGSFTEIIENPQYVFLLMSRTYGVIVPKQAFGSPEDVIAFLDAARTYWKNPDGAGTAYSDAVGTWPPPPQTLKSS